jgi:hypothetical protein
LKTSFIISIDNSSISFHADESVRCVYIKNHNQKELSDLSKRCTLHICALHINDLCHIENYHYLKCRYYYCSSVTQLTTHEEVCSRFQALCASSNTTTFSIGGLVFSNAVSLKSCMFWMNAFVSLNAIVFLISPKEF